jgi:hypothetical protein
MLLASSAVTSSPNHQLHQWSGKGSLQLLCPSFFEPFASFEVSTMLEFFLAKIMFFLHCFFSIQMVPDCSIFLYFVFCDFWFGCWFGIFGSRSMIYCQLLPDTLQWDHRLLPYPSMATATSADIHAPVHGLHVPGSLSSFFGA